MWENGGYSLIKEKYKQFSKNNMRKGFGFSVFLGNEIDKEFIDSMIDYGFRKIFTSVHIPEENFSKIKENLYFLGNICKEKNIELHIDTSKDVLSKLGFTENKIENLINLSITGVRIDYGIDNEYIARLSKKMIVSVNASTIFKEDFSELKKYGANFNNLIAWHNYYPKPFSGLDDKYFYEKNKWIKEEYNLPIYAFVQGENNLRGPIKKGLPTIESQRNLNPFVASLELIKDYLVDEVFIGDPGLSKITGEIFKDYIEKGYITVPVKWNNIEGYEKNLNCIYHNRKDFSGHIIRAEEGRLQKWPQINPEKSKKREIGFITLDNDLSGRYKGEINIVKKEMPTDENTNIIGRVEDEYIKVLPYILGGIKFKMEEWNDKKS